MPKRRRAGGGGNRETEEAGRACSSVQRLPEPGASPRLLGDATEPGGWRVAARPQLATCARFHVTGAGELNAIKVLADMAALDKEAAKSYCAGHANQAVVKNCSLEVASGVPCWSTSLSTCDTKMRQTNMLTRRKALLTLSNSSHLSPVGRQVRQQISNPKAL